MRRCRQPAVIATRKLTLENHPAWKEHILGLDLRYLGHTHAACDTEQEN
jgi:hypothetical protein